MRGELALVLLLACEPPPAPRLICHNANCAGAVDSARDATLAALAESLALRRDGRPPFDGIELDLVWTADACRFSHDPAADAPLAALAAELVAAELPATDDSFDLFVDLKHDDTTDLRAHAACALDTATTIAEATRDRQLVVTVTSKAPEMLAAVRADPRFVPGLGDHVTLRLGGDIGIPPPLGGDASVLADYDATLDLAIMGYNADFLTRAQYDALRALDLQLAQWMNTTTVESLDGIERYRPDYVLCSELPLLRNWLER